MNSLRIRAIKLERNNVENYDQSPYAVVISQDNLVWWVVSRHFEAKMAVEAAMALETFFKANQLGKASHVIWQTTLR